MAGYIRTKLTFEGDKETLTKIDEQLKSDKEVICFDHIISIDDKTPEAMAEKWGISEEPEEFDMILWRNDTRLEYSFDTKDKPPVKIYEKLAEMFPDYRMFVYYASEHYGEDCGIYESEKGSSELTFREPDDPFVFSCDVWEVDPDEAANEEMINYIEE